MQMPEWLKRVENRFPEKLTNVKDLAEKATAGKSKYVKALVPGLGEYELFGRHNYIPKKTRIAWGTVVTGFRGVGILASVITGNPFHLCSYGIFTAQEELFTWAYSSE